MDFYYSIELIVRFLIQRIGAGCLVGNEVELEQLLNRFLRHPEDIEKMRRKAAVALPGRSTERAVESIFQLIKGLAKTQDEDVQVIDYR